MWAVMQKLVSPLSKLTSATLLPSTLVSHAGVIWSRLVISSGIRVRSPSRQSGEGDLLLDFD
jgi:hypothetical protein